MASDKKMTLFWAEVTCDQKSKMAASIIIIKAPTVDDAWRILDREIAARKHLINEIVEIKMVADGQRGVTIEETGTHFWLFFDDKPVRIWPKQPASQESIISNKELN